MIQRILLVTKVGRCRKGTGKKLIIIGVPAYASDFINHINHLEKKEGLFLAHLIAQVFIPAGLK